MSQVKQQVSERMKYLFWSYDLNSLDLKMDKEYIIAQALNYGTWKDVQWLFSVYRREDVKRVIKHPQRGVWFQNALRFWSLMFDISLQAAVWRKALFSIHPKSEALNN